MSLNSSSTLEQITAAFDDNASYELNNSLSQAQAYTTACIMLLRRLPNSGQIDGQNVTLNTKFVQDELERVRRWVASYSDDGGVRFFDLSDCRD